MKKKNDSDSELPEILRTIPVELWDESIDLTDNTFAEKLWLKETDRRWKEIESGKVKTIPWEEVKAKIFAVWLFFGKK